MITNADRPLRWQGSLQALHWISLVLILAVATLGLVMVDLPKGDATRSLLYATHKALGLTVLALGVLRLLVRACTRAPAPLPAPSWQQRAAALSHAGMYLVLLALPLSGWLLNSAAGQPLPWFGLFDVPALIGKTPAWRKPLDTAHVWLFWTLVALVAVHLLAVLQHTCWHRDQLLHRMLPARLRRRA